MTRDPRSGGEALSVGQLVPVTSDDGGGVVSAIVSDADGDSRGGPWPLRVSEVSIVIGSGVVSDFEVKDERKARRADSRRRRRSKKLRITYPWV